MKTLLGSLLAIGLISTSASAWYCPPGYGYGNGHGHWQSYGHQRPSYGHVQKPVIEKVVPAVPAEKIEPAPAPGPAPEQAPPK